MARISSVTRYGVTTFVGVALVVGTLSARVPRVTTPEQQFGHPIGADYVLPNYTQLTDYWQKLARESDRMQVVSIGKTAEGRDQWMAIITAPENLASLARYKDIARRLALAEALTDDEARRLAAEGKAVVWIDGGLHATEVLGAQQLMELVYQMVSRTDAETTRILRDVILLAVHANPDGMELVSDWYMREPEPMKRRTFGIPRLYQKYIGHDNNRDSYMNAMPETTNMSRVLYREWFPQIVYNHHQTGPTGTVLFAPPFRDPFNYNYDPLIPVGIDMVGAAMHGRFVAESKPGATMRRGANYSTWFNGGLRTTAYFHNMIGILTETIGNPTPMEIPFVPQRQIASGDLPYPIAPQTWRFRQSIEYSITANRAILDLASRYRETFLFNIYQMGRNSIRRGSEDSWTIWPNRLAAVQGAIEKDRQEGGQAAFNPSGTIGGFATPVDGKYFSLLRDPAHRDPRGYVIPSSQPDFLTATKFVNALLKSGVTVHRAATPFEVGGKQYPANSYVVKTAQAFRPHVLDMFEPQDHPNDVQYPGGPPIPPYDNAGYTLAYQMGVEFDRVLDGFDGPFERINALAAPPPGVIPSPRVAGPAAGYVFSHTVNDAFIVVNRLLRAGERVSWLKGGNPEVAPGTMFVAARPGTQAVLEKAAAELGVSFTAVTTPPAVEALELKPVRIGLWDRYGGSMPSGWVRWLFEQFEFPFEVVFAPGLDAGSLAERFDVLVFVDEGIPESDRPSRGDDTPALLAQSRRPPAAEEVPAQYRSWLGSVTVAKTVPQLRAFVEAGGTLIAIGSSASSIAEHFGLPVGDALVEKTAHGERHLSRDKFYVPGSVLRTAVDASHPLAYGFGSHVDVLFDNSPAFTIRPDASAKGVRVVAWYDSPTPLRSGWAWGQPYLDGAAAVVEASVGKGVVFLFGPEITHRGQAHGTFKFLFNGIYYGPARRAAR